MKREGEDVGVMSEVRVIWVNRLICVGREPATRSGWKLNNWQFTSTNSFNMCELNLVFFVCVWCDGV